MSVEENRVFGLAEGGVRGPYEGHYICRRETGEKRGKEPS